MTNKDDFIRFVDSMYQFCNDNGYFSEEYDYNLDKAKEFFDSFKNNDKTKSIQLTEKGKMILSYVKDNYLDEEFKAKDIAEGLPFPPRSVTGALLKLANDELLEKVTAPKVSPVIYKITENGKNILNKENDSNEKDD